MLASVSSAANQQLRVERIRPPAPGRGEVLVDVAGCGVCHTDLHVLLGEVPFPFPNVLGHEVSGRVAAVGPGVTTVRVGQPVVCSFIMPCGRCWYCARGQEEICQTFFSVNRLRGQLYDGTTRLFREDGTPLAMYSMGGLAERCVVPDTAVFGLPDTLPLAESAILGCALLTGYGALRHAGDVRAGDTVAVIGVGGVGSAIIALARHFGATRVIAVDIRDDALAHARTLGATDLVRAATGAGADTPARIRELTGGSGVDRAFEALGHPDTFGTAVEAVRDGGRAVMVGIAPAGVRAEVEITRLVRRRIEVVGSYGARPRQDMPRLIDLVAGGALDLTAMVTRRYPLDAADQAYRDLRERRITGRAIVVNPTVVDPTVVNSTVVNSTAG